MTVKTADCRPAETQESVSAWPAETQESVSAWAAETFGPAGSNIRVAARANEEMAELIRALSADDNSPKAAEELADVLIVLYRLATRLGVDIHDQVNRKMTVNRLRKWALDNTGHGYHVRDKTTNGEQARLVDENNTMRRILANSDVACVYCGLSKADMARCPSGFPGCARADDMEI